MGSSFRTVPLKEGADHKSYSTLMANYSMMQEIPISSILDREDLVWTSPHYALLLSMEMLRPFKNRLELKPGPVFRELITYDLGGHIGQILNNDPYGLDLDVYTDTFARPEERYNKPGAFIFRLNTA